MTIRTFNLGDRVLIVRSQRNGEVQEFPFEEKDTSPHFRYRITVNQEGSKVKRSFAFYTSTHDYMEGKTRISQGEIRDALKCILEDAISGDMDCEEFCREYGYTDCKGVRVWKACQKTRDKIHDLGIFSSELYDMVNELNEMEEKES